MVKVLFICLGNICRSPMAKIIFNDLVIQKQMQDQFEIDSAATGTWTTGSDLFPDARNVLEKNNIFYQKHEARHLEKQDYDKYDYLIGMDKENIENILKIVGEDKQNKVYKLLDFSNEPKPIDDPYFTKEFDRAFSEIKTGCESFYKYLEENKQIKK